MSRQLSATNWSDVWRPILAAFACAYVLLVFPPWQFSMPSAGLDPSWVEVIGYGAHHGWQWGRDLVFTYGPLGFLLPNPYQGEAVGLTLAANTFLAIAFAQGLVAILPREAPWWSIGLFFLAAFPAGMMGRSAYTAFGLLAALIYFQRPHDARHWRPMILAAAAGVFALVYVSSGVLGLGIFLLLDLSRLLHRRWPIFVPVFALSFVLSYLVAGQEATHLSEFLKASIELISGYTGAMSIVGNRLELAAFPALSAVLFASILWSERAGRHRRNDRGDALLLVAALSVHWFVMFKSGFVRHDFHSVMAWQRLAMTAAVYAAMRWHNASSGVRWTLIGLSIAASTASVFAWEQKVQIAAVGKHVDRVLIRQPVLALQEARVALVDSAEWKRTLLERRMQALSEIRTAVPFPSVDGAVDVIPAVQSSVLAHGFVYRPRPVFQDYSAYTPWLIELNRAHYRSADAAEYVFFSPSTIDNRYPLLDQAGAINELLTLYDPLAFEHNLLVLKRRAEPLRMPMASTTESTTTLGHWVSLDAVNAPVMLSVALSPNLLGRLAGFVFRPPILTLTVRLANGSEQEFRLIEGIARSGFLLSPLVEHSLDFAAAATGTWAAVKDRQVVAFRLDAGSESGRRFYGQPITYTATVLRLETDAARARGADLLRVSFRRLQVAHTMAALSSVKKPFVTAMGTELFAHSPAQLNLPVQSASLVRAKFAIRPGAWSQGGATDGVCFRISEVSEDRVRRRLFDRCLEPVSRAEDRPEQTAEIPVGLAAPGTLVFETECRANCDWDWSYWKDIDVAP